MHRDLYVYISGQLVGNAAVQLYFSFVDFRGIRQPWNRVHKLLILLPLCPLLLFLLIGFYFPLGHPIDNLVPSLLAEAIELANPPGRGQWVGEGQGELLGVQMLLQFQLSPEDQLDRATSLFDLFYYIL